MAQFLQLVIFLLCPVFTATVAEAQANQDECRPKSCNSREPSIQFPFWLKGLQPDRCGYPSSGFQLSCSNDQDTVLQIPNAINLFVKKIDYKNQQIYVYDADDCLPRLLRNHKISASPFTFDQEFQWNYTFFNCSSNSINRISPIRCLSIPGYQVQPVRSDDALYTASLFCCQKIYDIPRIPVEIIENQIESCFKLVKANLWKLCCTSKECRLNTSRTGTQSECSINLNPHRGPSN